MNILEVYIKNSVTYVWMANITLYGRGLVPQNIFEFWVRILWLKSDFLPPKFDLFLRVIQLMYIFINTFFFLFTCSPNSFSYPSMCTKQLDCWTVELPWQSFFFKSHNSYLCGILTIHINTPDISTSSFGLKWCKIKPHNLVEREYCGDSLHSLPKKEN